MKKIVIEGGKTLTGEVKISGMKNDALALLPAAILSSGTVEISNVPNITDIDNIKKILEYLGATVTRENDIFKIDTTNIENKPITEKYSSKLRASYYFMGALLAKYKEASIYFPGGCNLGPRPINIHLKGFEALGAEIIEEGNKYTIKAKKLKGNKIKLDFPSVGATINIMVAATLAEGTTILQNTAKEPEIVNVATMLNSLGANISGAGTNKIKIVGVKELKGGFHEVIPDRIEAGTYMIIGAALGKKFKVSNIIPEHLEAITSKLEEMGVDIKTYNDSCIINAPKELKSVTVKTAVYPGMPTDLGQPLEALMTQCVGDSILNETIYSKRIGNIEYLNKMGANIDVELAEETNNKKTLDTLEEKDTTIVTVHGKTPLNGAKVSATDLRGGASVLIAGLIAEGTTTIVEVEHLLRGYENLEEKLTKLGASIKVT